MKYSKTHENRMLKTWMKITALLIAKNVIFTEHADNYWDGTDYRRLALIARTSIGEMRVALYENWIHTRFEDPKKAIALFGEHCVNPFSGKHNFHPSGAKATEIMKVIYDWFEDVANKLDSVYNTDSKIKPHRYN